MRSWSGIFPESRHSDMASPSGPSSEIWVPLIVSTDVSLTFTSRSTETTECPGGSADLLSSVINPMEFCKFCCDLAPCKSAIS